MNEIEDDVLGVLEFSSDRGQWEGQVELAADHIADIIVRGADENAVGDLTRIRSFVVQLKLTDAHIREAAADSLLALYNTSWRVGPILDADAFKRRLEIGLISLEVDGSMEVWCGDTEEDPGCDLFGGHSIVVPISADGNIGKARLTG